MTRPPLPEIHWRTIPTNPRPEPTSLFERCVEAADLTDLQDGLPDYPAITRAVLETLRTHTPSLRTAEEIDRVLGGGA